MKRTDATQLDSNPLSVFVMKEKYQIKNATQPKTTSAVLFWKKTLTIVAMWDLSLE